MALLLEEIRELSDRVVLAIWSDGHEGMHFADHLRKNCPCALCREKEEELPKERNPFKIIGNPDSLEDVTITSWEMIGRYAVAFRFSDGHHNGIYPYDLLRELCQCDICTGDSIRIQGPFKP